MSDIKFSILCSILSVLITLLAFGVSFSVLHDTFPGYKILAYPGILATRLFSEEIDFWPKLRILLIGQGIAFFLAIYSLKKLNAYIRKRSDENNRL